MSPRRQEYDEDDVRIRPGKGSRPRTRNRPAHADAVSAAVVGVDRGRFTCRTGARGTVGPDAPVVVAMKARELGRTSVVVGDRVGLVGDVSGTPDALARIVRVEPLDAEQVLVAGGLAPGRRVVVQGAELLDQVR